jgi:hypothetical protein
MFVIPSGARNPQFADKGLTPAHHGAVGPNEQLRFTFWMYMPLLPLRSSSKATAESPDRTMPDDKPALFAGSEDTGNCWHITLPAPLSRVA